MKRKFQERKERERKKNHYSRVNKKEILELKKEKAENIDKLKKKVEKKQNKRFKKQKKNKPEKIEEKNGEISRRKRLKIGLFVSSLIAVLFIVRIGWIQFVMGPELKQMAREQQSIDRAVNPRRGTIYDATR